MKNNFSYQEMLRHENAITRLKIQAEFGIELNTISEMNPAVENMWLNQILEYERLMQNKKMMTVGSLLTQSSYRSADELDDEEISNALHEIMSELLKNNILVDAISDVDDREMYRFITEDLVNEEVSDSMPQNMLCCYMYDEFYPDDERDVREIAEEFFKWATTGNEEEYSLFMCKDQDTEESDINFKKLRRRLQLFTNAFDEINLEKFEVDSVELDGQKALVRFDCRMKVLPPGNKYFHEISGPGTIHFEKLSESWKIVAMEMAGMV